MGKIQKILLLIVLPCCLLCPARLLADSADSADSGTDSTPETVAVSAGKMSYSLIYLGYTSNASNNSLQISNIRKILTDT